MNSFITSLLAGKEVLNKFRGDIPKVKKVDAWDGLDKK